MVPQVVKIFDRSSFHYLSMLLSFFSSFTHAFYKGRHCVSGGNTSVYEFSFFHHETLLPALNLVALHQKSSNWNYLERLPNPILDIKSLLFL